jgi:glucose/mannose-6-phosphate isomerase
MKKSKKPALRRASRSTSRRGSSEAILSASLFQKMDPSDLKSDYDAWPSLARSSWSETEVPVFERERIDRVIFAGMGGSSLTGELLVDIAREKGSKFSFESIKDYHTPQSASERSLIIGMSASGATEETLSVLSEAHARGMIGFSFGSGGPLETFSKEKWNFPFIRTKMLKVPRSSLPGIFYPVLKLLVKNKLIEIEESEVEESIEVLKDTRDDLARGSVEKIFALAEAWTSNSPGLPLIYSSARTRAVGLRARQSINENAKMHAFNAEIPELCHNEIVGWDSKASATKHQSQSDRNRHTNTALLLRLDEDDPPEIKIRFDIVEEIVRKAEGTTVSAPYLGRNYLARVISMLYLLDYLSYYMAIFRGIDPIKTPSILLLKQELAKRLNYIEKL